MRKMILRKLSSLLLLITCLLLVWGCNEKAEPKQQQYPILQTNAVTDVDSTGVTLNAEVLMPGTDDVLKYGFVWTTKPKPTLENFNVTLGQEMPLKFSTRISFDLTPGISYYVRAYVITSSNTVYGSEEIFTSLGSSTPMVQSFSPTTAIDGDTVLIVGKNFGSIVSSNVVSVGSSVARVIACTNETLKILVPAIAQGGSYKIHVTSNKKTSVSANSITIVNPEIVSITPARGKDGALVTVNGKHFSYNSTFNKVMLQNKPCDVMKSSATQLTIYIPYTTFSGNVKIVVNVNGKLSVNGENFFVEGPAINSVEPLQASINDVVTITGEGFSTVLTENEVLFGTVQAMVLSASDTKLTVAVPPLPGDPVAVSVRRSTKSNTYAQNFVANSAWHLVSSNALPTGERGMATGFSVGNLGFITLGRVSDYDLDITSTIRQIYKDLWEFNAVTNQWTKRADFPGEARYYATAFTIGSKAYVGSGASFYQDLLSDFYVYDTDANAWSKIAGLPGTGRYGAVSFSAGGKGYVGLGAGEYSGNTPDKADFFEYNPATDTWKQFNGPGKVSTYAFAFTVNGRGFVVLQGKELWEITPGTNTWTRKSDYPDKNPFGSFAFTLEGKAYAGSGFYSAGFHLIYSNNFYRYDPDTDKWTTLEGFDRLKRFTGVAWGLNGKGYVVTGQSNAINNSDWPYYYLNDFWVYNKP